jgi:flagellar hook-associated protein 3 FlgL
MRVSTANSFDATVNNLARRQAELVAQQERLSTGKRVLRASDDPVAATLAESAQNRLTRVQGDLRAMEASRASLAQAESGLAESGDLIQKARDLIVSAGNGAFSQSEREDIARQLVGLREQMIGVANLKDNAGRTLFGGLGGSATPFVELYGPTGGVVQFDGQRGQQAAGNTSLPQSLDGDAIWKQIPKGNGSFTLSLPSSNTSSVRTGLGQFTGLPAIPSQGYDITFAEVAGAMQYTVTNRTPPATNLPSQTGVPYIPGMSIAFDGLSFDIQNPAATGDRIELRSNTATAPTDIFKVMQDTVDALRYTGTNSDARRIQDLGRTLTELDAGLDRVLLARGYAGEMLNRADSLESLLDTRTVAYEREKSQLEDLDLIKGISDFQNQQVGMEAALKSYAQIQRLSLFEFVR